eukprot:608042-Pelagomonas_calceolata.AAC.1
MSAIITAVGQYSNLTSLQRAPSQSGTQCRCAWTLPMRWGSSGVDAPMSAMSLRSHSASQCVKEASRLGRRPGTRPQQLTLRRLLVVSLTS